MRALVHVGLSVAFVLAPTLCCCKARGLGAVVHAAPAPGHASCPNPLPAQPVEVESCCVKAKTSCCHESNDAPQSAPAKPTGSKPAEPSAPGSCACCVERPDAAQTETKPTVAAAEPTGELLSLAVAALAAGTSEHPGRFRGSHPSDRTGVDARSAALFERHVMRC